MQNQKLYRMTLTGVLTAIIFVATAYLHVNTNNGYTHFGDGVIFLTASLLPLPYAVFAGAVGAGLADVVSMPIWAPATLIIKTLTVLVFTCKKPTILCARNLLALIPALFFCVAGYSLYEALVLLDGFSLAALGKALLSFPAYCVQIGGSALLYVILGAALDKLHIKQRFFS